MTIKTRNNLETTRKALVKAMKEYDGPMFDQMNALMSEAMKAIRAAEEMA